MVTYIIYTLIGLCALATICVAVSTIFIDFPKARSFLPNKLKIFFEKIHQQEINCRE